MITQLDPNNARIGENIDIIGTGFDPRPNMTEVVFSPNVRADRINVQPLGDRITVKVPMGAITGQIQVITPGGTATGPVFNPVPAAMKTPSNLTAALIGSQIKLSWQDANEKESGFKLERKAGTGTYQLLATLGLNATSFSDANISSGITYTYQVKAYNASGESDYSNEASVPVPLARNVRLSANPTTQSITAGQSASYTIELERTNFAGPVDLAVSGLPAGATAGFNPDPTAGNSSILTVNTVAGTAAGTSVLTISGSASGASVTSTTVNMTVNLAPSVRLSATPAVQAIVAGQSTSYTITLKRTNFTGPVNLAVSGLPTGATAGFSPNPATGTSGVLTITTAANTPGGSYNLTLSGSAPGATVAPAAVSLTVTALSRVTLSASPSTVSVRAGESATYTVILNRDTFTGAVPLAVRGLPLGATVVSNPGFTTGNNTTLVVNTSPSAAPGTYPLTLTGTAQGVPVASTTVSMTVTPSVSTLPVITGFAPSKGPIGTPVTIVGANFTQGTAVQFTGAFNTHLDVLFTVLSMTEILTGVPGVQSARSRARSASQLRRAPLSARARSPWSRPRTRSPTAEKTARISKIAARAKASSRKARSRPVGACRQGPPTPPRPRRVSSGTSLARSCAPTSRAAPSKGSRT
jgi:hypothetical protein